MLTLKFFLNDQFLPIILHHYKARSDGSTLSKSYPDKVLNGFNLCFDHEDNPIPSEKIKIDESLLRNGVVLSKAYLEKTYNVEVDRTNHPEIDTSNKPGLKRKKIEYKPSTVERVGKDMGHIDGAT